METRVETTQGHFLKVAGLLALRGGADAAVEEALKTCRRSCFHTALYGPQMFYRFSANILDSDDSDDM